MPFATEISAPCAIPANVDVPFDGHSGRTYEHEVVCRQPECALADAAYPGNRSASLVSDGKQAHSYLMLHDLSSVGRKHDPSVP